MTGTIYRDALSAWRGLREIGGLEPDGRDEDFAQQIKDELDPSAASLDTALENASIKQFLNAFFQATQPFANIYQDILDFFQKAEAREGQNQWRLSVGDSVTELSHFEEFLEHWSQLECEIEVPALDRHNAFLMHSVLQDLGEDGYYLLKDEFDKNGSGFSDVDAWLAAYEKGEYKPFPRNIHPDNFGPGLDDAARVVIAALSIIQNQGFNREEMLTLHRARSHKSVDRDAFHPWTIAQNETDYWLRSSIQYLARLLVKTEKERSKFGCALTHAFAKFPRRKLNADFEIKDIERLLSLPAWKNRYELYGVWVATEIISALEGHDITLHSDNGEFKFAFKETKLADIDSARPKLELISERKTPLSDPIGKSRKNNVQPDFGLWAQDRRRMRKSPRKS